jgi:Sigma 54 modulation protein / S30EA ribosomal protein
MSSTLTLTFRHIERSGALEARAREFGERLRRSHDRISHCHITVLGEAQDGGLGVVVKIHVSVPGAQIHADGVAPDGAQHQDVFLALRDAYESARRQLMDLRRDGTRSSLVSGASGTRVPQWSGHQTPAAASPPPHADRGPMSRGRPVR